MVQIIGLAIARHYSVFYDLLIATALEMLKKLELQLYAVETSATQKCWPLTIDDTMRAAVKALQSPQIIRI